MKPFISNICKSFSEAKSTVSIRIPKDIHTHPLKKKQLRTLPYCWLDQEGGQDSIYAADTAAFREQATSKSYDPGLCSTSPMPRLQTQGEFKAGTQPYLQQLGLHSRRDSGRVNELERRSSVVGVLCWECHQHLDTMVAAMHRHRAAPVCSVHLQDTSPRCFGDKLQRVFRCKHIYFIILCCILFAGLNLKPGALNRQDKYSLPLSHTLSKMRMDFNNQHKCSCS